MERFAATTMQRNKRDDSRTGIQIDDAGSGNILTLLLQIHSDNKLMSLSGLSLEYL